MGFRLTTWLAGLAVCVIASAGASGAVIDGVPTYYWYHGCVPTSVGMLVGYWDGLPGYGNLFDGDASVETQDVRDMIASQEHIDDPYSANHDENCIADFLRTDSQGLTTYDAIVPGIRGYIEWDNPATVVDESYQVDVTLHKLELLQGDFNWDLYKLEIDAGRPVVLDVVAYVGGDILGHTVLGFGYQEDMFEISLMNGSEQINLTVPGFAVRDTWPDGPLGTTFWGWDGEPVEPVIDENGVEWWPWVEIGDGGPREPYYEWLIYRGISVDIVPEPAMLGLVVLSMLVAVPGRRQMS